MLIDRGVVIRPFFQMNEKLVLTDHIVTYDNEKKGVLAPSTFFGKGSQGEHLVWGPKGMRVINTDNCGKELGLLQALEETGSLIPGDPQDIDAVNTLLKAPSSSRNTSFAACTTNSCSEIIEFSKNIAKSRVLIVGCGGIGSNAALMLAGVGIRSFCLLDPDVIELSNLNRQLVWTRGDVGQLKVECLQKALVDRFEDCQIETLSVTADFSHLLKISNDFDAVILSGDDPPTLVSLGPVLAENCNVHVAGGGYVHHKASFYCYSPSKTKKIDLPTSYFQWDRSPHSIMPSYGPTNLVLASAMVSHLILRLTRSSSHPPTALEWDGLSLQWKNIEAPTGTIYGSLTDITSSTIQTASYASLVGLLHQENTPPGAMQSLIFWLQKSCINKTSHVLDLACSTGYSSRNVARLTGCTGAGIDIDQEGIRSARLMAERDDVQTFEYHIADATELPFADGTFSHILAGCTFAFISHQTKALKEAHRVLKTGGALCVANFFYHSEPPPALLDAIHQHIGFRPQSNWTQEWWATFFSNSGFDLVEEKISLLSGRTEDEIESEVKSMVYDVSHRLSQADTTILETAYQKMKSARLAANEQRDYQGLAVQVWRKK